MRTTTTPPLLLALALAACGDEATTPPAPPRDATPPVLEILAPEPDSLLLASAAVRVRAKCTEDDPRGCTVKLLLRDTLVAEGADSVNAVVSLEKHLGQTIRFVFAATNASGGTARAETGDFRVVGGRWTDLRLPAVPGTVRDATPDRILYIQGDHLRVRDVATGAEQGVYSESNAASTWAQLFPGGVLLSYPAAYGYKPTGVREVGGSGHWSGPGFSQQVRGRWAAWLTHLGDVVRDDVVARRLTIVPGVAAVVPDALDVADDGTIAYTVRPRDDFGSDDGRPRQLYLLRGDTPEQIAVDSGAVPLYPETDGTNVVYMRRTTTPEGVRYQLVLAAPGGDVALAPPRATRVHPSAYQAEAGWVVYNSQDDAGITQVWARSPAGDARRITPWATPSTLRTLGPAGQTMVENGGRWYYARTPGEALVDIGPTVQGSVRWYHGYPETYLMTGGRLLRLDI